MPAKLVRRHQVDGQMLEFIMNNIPENSGLDCSSPRVTSLEEISLPLTNGPISVSSSEASPDPKQTKSIATSASLGALFGGNGIRKDCLLNALVSPSTNMLTLPLHKVHDLRVSALLAQASVDTAHIVKTEVQTNQLKEFNGTESSILDVHALPLGRSFSRSVIKPEDNKANRGDAATTLSPSEDSIKSLNHQPPQAHPHHHHRHPSVKSSVEVCGDRIGASIVAFQALDNKEAVLVNGLTPDIHSVRGQTIFACMHNGQSEDLNENSKVRAFCLPFSFCTTM
ncbi:unnamed protein product [Protopolystoma xenopodis]|uniref:Uncharacterized protein n=1 Tax=Protopolystoma xenopodis TaxID=117903 RepID=A0A448WKE6_9PLAT|nr:unnamed protein product [Protopolystoma xenopodis]